MDAQLRALIDLQGVDSRIAERFDSSRVIPGNERVIGAELRQTAAQGANVLINVGTFTLGGGRVNEIRFSAADVSQAVAPLGANGFNIPSLLSVHETAPFFYALF